MSTDFFGPAATPPHPPAVTIPPPVRSAPVAATPPPPVTPGRPVVVETTTQDIGADVSLDQLLGWVVDNGASDLHLTADGTPNVRLHGSLTPVEGAGPIDAGHLEQMLTGIMNDRQREEFETRNDIDLSYTLDDVARFRVNVFRQRGNIAAVLRTVPTRIRTVDELSIPQPIRDLVNLPRGLVLVTGQTGSGKSTLLASLMDLANRTRRAHILTIEDPIEFTHQSQLSLVNQREVHEDTTSFATALRASLRQDPDIIMLGEMRDLETTHAAIEAAETGHLVFGTMHTKSAPEAVSRAVNMFPKEIQNQIQTTLASCLEAVITQTLIKTVDGTGRAPAREVMMLGPDSRNLIRNGKLEQLPSVLQTGAERGMHTLNADLARLVKEERVSYEEAAANASDLAELDRHLGRPHTARRIA